MQWKTLVLPGYPQSSAICLKFFYFLELFVFILLSARTVCLFAVHIWYQV